MSKIALYIRLSVEDQMKKGESESIINQRQYLNDYLNKNEEFKSFQREEYIEKKPLKLIHKYTLSTFQSA